MIYSKKPRINSYVSGFFPRDYSVEIVILPEQDVIAPRVTISVAPPMMCEVSLYTAYLHEILDISYMGQVATLLLGAIDNSEAKRT